MEQAHPSTVIHGSVQGLVQGDGAVVTLIYQGGEQKSVPFLAPPRQPHPLVGREDLLARIKSTLTGSYEPSRSCVVTGIPGAGKTSLALEIAHDEEIIKFFHDGVLWAGLGQAPDIRAHL